MTEDAPTKTPKTVAKATIQTLSTLYEKLSDGSPSEIKDMILQLRKDEELVAKIKERKDQQIAVVHLLQGVTIQADAIFLLATKPSTASEETIGTLSKKVTAAKKGDPPKKMLVRVLAPDLATANMALKVKMDAVSEIAKILGLVGSIKTEQEEQLGAMSDAELEVLAKQEKTDAPDPGTGKAGTGNP